MDDDGMKKLGVIAIIVLLALYTFGYVAFIFIIGTPVEAVVVYAVISTAVLVLLIYEGWQRLKEIDEGLEDAVNDY
ncbi:MAG: hypothetical protein J5673_02600 [Candidatus Methanomethylophilaceae archaeon]|nr:hypothetical protein [Candidatus Methanomethylophilaceae archaeon]